MLHNFMPLYLIIFLSLIFSTNSHARELELYIESRQETACKSPSGEKISIRTLLTMLQNSPRGNLCQVLKMDEFPNPREANLSAQDGYNGAVTNIQVFENFGPNSESTMGLIQMRDIELCALEDRNKLTVVYSHRELTKLTMPNSRISAILPAQEWILEKSIFEFTDGKLVYIGNYRLPLSLTGNVGKMKTVECGIPGLRN